MMQEQQAQPTATVPLKEVVKTIAAQLGETTSQAHAHLYRVVKTLGPEQSLAFVQKAVEVEANGGMMLPDQSRRRTLGGVFFFLVRQQGPPEVQALWAKPNAAKKKSRTTEAAPSSQPVASEPPLHWQDRVSLIEDLRAEKGTITTVKMTVIGRPGKIKTVGTCVVTTMQSTKVPSLPKGMPVPPTVDTTYTVYIALKQWRKVEESLKLPEDALIVEGFPVLDAQTNSIAVFASNTTTKLLQAALRQEKKAEEA